MNGLLICHGRGDYKNIGDYIQSIAQEQFWNRTDIFVEREKLNQIKCNEKINIIMNGWFMWFPETFCLKDCLNPLFISFHIAPSIADKLLTEDNIEQLKKFAPIGARDLETKSILERKGIESYFSGCLTLTLGNTFKNTAKNGKIYIVDPYYELGGTNSKKIKYIRALFYLIKHYKNILPLKNRFKYEFKSPLSKKSPKLDKLLHLASFYNAYSKILDKNVIYKANYINHIINIGENSTEQERLQIARNYIEMYSKASLVITSRIHAALPCLAVETPTIFVNSNKLTNSSSIRSNGRFGGIINLFNLLDYENGQLIPNSPSIKKVLLNGKISKITKIENPSDYKILRDKLNDKVKKFVDECRKN